MLITKVFSVIKDNRVINIVIDLGATDYCFVNFDTFADYEKLESLLIERIVSKMKVVDLIYFPFDFLFHFLFLELGLGLEWQCYAVTPWLHWMTWSQVTWYMKGYKRFLSGAVHTGVEVRRMDSEMSRLVEWPWLQLMCCAVCLPRGRNFRWRRESPSGSECWMVCRRWTLEVEFNKRLSLSIIRLANYSVTTSLIYRLIV